MVAPLFKHARRHPRLLAFSLALCAASLFALSGFAESKIEGPIEGAEIVEPLAPFLVLDAALAGSRIVAVGERGHVLLSDDAGGTWRPVRTPLQATLTAVYFTDQKSGWAVGHDAVIVHTGDGGESWRIQNYAPDLESPLLDVWFADPMQGLAIGAYGLFLETRDGGETWSSRQIGEDDAHHNAIVEAVDGRLYIAGEFGRILRSSDRGETWTALASPYEASFFGILAPPDGALLVFGLRGRAYRSEDGGTTWRKVVTGTENSLMGGAVRGDEVILGGLGGVLLTGKNDGTAFTRHQRTDRKAISAVVSIDGIAVSVFGAFGADTLVVESARPRVSDGG